LYLADLGADVLQIVSPSRVDFADIEPPFFPGTNVSAMAAFLRRNKRSIALNLKDPRGTRIVHQLLADYDIIVEQFRPGVMAKLGLDYESLRQINPSLIYCSITGYGQTGPLRDRAGHDVNYISRSGVASYSGRTNTGPTLMGTQFADFASGSHNAVIGILAALVHRHVTGEGQSIDISITDGMIALNATYGAASLVFERDLQREETVLNGAALYDYYETKDGKYISVGCIEPQFSENFFNTIGRSDLVSGGFAPQNIEQVKKEVRDILKSKTLKEWKALFEATDACVEPVMTLSEVFQDPFVHEREMLVEVSLPAGGTVRQIANPIKFSKTKPSYRWAGSGPGVHTAEVLRSLGYTDNEITEFEKTGLFK
jgi:crotonobetainyl-CoA:carnitine CoA-transferase CaiB-like acyl-CoA transferase